MKVPDDMWFYLMLVTKFSGYDYKIDVDLINPILKKEGAMYFPFVMDGSAVRLW